MAEPLALPHQCWAPAFHLDRCRAERSHRPRGLPVPASFGTSRLGLTPAITRSLRGPGQADIGQPPMFLLVGVLGLIDDGAEDRRAFILARPDHRDRPGAR